MIREDLNAEDEEQSILMEHASTKARIDENGRSVLQLFKCK